MNYQLKSHGWRFQSYVSPSHLSLQFSNMQYSMMAMKNRPPSGSLYLKNACLSGKEKSWTSLALRSLDLVTRETCIMTDNCYRNLVQALYSATAQPMDVSLAS